MAHFIHIIGARPNYIKCFPVVKALNKWSDNTVIHTGQHQSPAMRDVLLQQLGLNVDIKNTEGYTDIAYLKTWLLKILMAIKSDMVFIYGDTNSSLAGALAAHNAELPIAHVEAGLRSFDPTMLEENNRIVIDELSAHWFVTEQSGYDNLQREFQFGVKQTTKIHMVGNTMIDTLRRVPVDIKSENFFVVTLHRPVNVDDACRLSEILDTLEYCDTEKFILVMHPRLERKLKEFNKSLPSNVIGLPAMDYYGFIGLVSKAKGVITDSGGLQEETTALLKPCLTLRDNTERPVTITHGTNTLAILDNLHIHIDDINKGLYKKGIVPPLWDGNAAERISETCKRLV
jgi:UDP-N-acetylglucosamine 2-epimerase (non-hydrolysing)